MQRYNHSYENFNFQQIFFFLAKFWYVLVVSSINLKLFHLISETETVYHKKIIVDYSTRETNSHFWFRRRYFEIRINRSDANLWIRRSISPRSVPVTNFDNSIGIYRYAYAMIWLCLTSTCLVVEPSAHELGHDFWDRMWNINWPASNSCNNLAIYFIQQQNTVVLEWSSQTGGFYNRWTWIGLNFKWSV